MICPTLPRRKAYVKLHISYLKGIVSRDWEWLQWVLNYRLEEYRLPEYICNAFRHYIHVIIGNKHALVVSYLTVTLWMISNNCRSSPVINAHLPIDQAGGSYCSGQKMPGSWGRHSEALDNLGSGNLEGGGIGERVEEEEVSLQATWDQGGRILSQLGGFPSK